MADFSVWFQANWPNAITGIGVIGSLWIGIWTANRELERSERENLERMAERHSKLWAQMSEQPSLHRILRVDADLAKQPATVEEEEFANRVMVHFLTTWRMAQRGSLITLDELAADVRDFFSRPLPQAVWEKTKGYRNPKFVRFIERALNRRGRLTGAGAYDPDFENTARWRVNSKELIGRMMFFRADGREQAIQGVGAKTGSIIMTVVFDLRNELGFGNHETTGRRRSL